MSHLEVLDFIILILEGLLGIATLCEAGYRIYKEYKSYMEDRKKRMKNKTMRDWDGPDDKDMEMGWGTNSSSTSSPSYCDEQLPVLDDEQLNSIEHERVWEFELDKMEREARRILPGGLPYGKASCGWELKSAQNFDNLQNRKRTKVKNLSRSRYDLESFFYVFLFIAIGGHRGLPGECRLKLWQGNWPEIAEKKRKDISSNDNFAAIIAEFRQEFKGLESLAYALGDLLFFPDGNGFFTGMEMDVEAKEKLYSAMIDAFEKAVVEKRD